MARDPGPDSQILWFIVVGAVAVLGLVIAARAEHDAIYTAGLILFAAMVLVGFKLIAHLQDQAWGNSKGGH